MDYSPFLYKNVKPDKPQKGSKDNDGNAAPPLPTSKKGKKSSAKNGIFAVLVVVLCFAIVFAAADLFSGGALVAKLKETISPTDSYTHYFVVRGSYDNKTKAASQAVIVRESGGAGYIYAKDNAYHVVVCACKNKKQAENMLSASDKIMELSYSLPTPITDDRSARNFYSDCVSTINGYVDKLYTVSDGLTNATTSDNEAYAVLSDIRNSLLITKDALYASELPTEDKTSVLNLINPIFGGLDAIITVQPEQYFDASVKYVLIGEIIAFCS